MKVLWISGICWNDNGEYKFPVTLPGSISGSLFQQSMIEGMEANDSQIEITLLTDYCSTFKHIIPGFKWSHNGKSVDVSISVIQIPLVSLLSKAINLENACKKLCENTEFDIAVVYMIHTPYLWALKTAKRVIPKLKSVLIVPDLAEFTDVDLSKKPLKRALKKCDSHIIEMLYDYVDSFVLFAESMKEKLPINGKPTLVIEGVYSSCGLDFKVEEKRPAVMYAGSIPFGFGIENIVEAFDLLNESNLELWIFGEGPMHDYLVNAAKKNPQIKYYGFVLREELFKYEKQASILINARNPEDEYTKYSFPSKTFEYMVSGTPFLTTWLKGFPEEYREYLYILPDNKPETIANCILDMIRMPQKEKDRFGKCAHDFIIKNKNPVTQSKHFLDFLNIL